MASPTSVEGLGPGDHACLTFSDGEERLDIVASFIQTGLTRDQQVVCFTESVPPDGLAADLERRGVPARASMGRGQLVVRTAQDSVLSHGAFEAQKMIDVLGAQLDRAQRLGYAGLRVAADMAWAARGVAGADQVLIYESQVNQLFSDRRLTAICQYDREHFDAVTLAGATASHPLAVAATVYHEDPVLRICRQHLPAGVRVAGEIDYLHAQTLADALSEAIRLDRHVYVNLVQLQFIDGAVATTVVRAALGLGGGRSMVVTCQRAVARVLRLVGADSVGGLQIVVVHGEP